jgi:hypothetical protein
MTKRERRRLSDDGLPKDVNEFTVEMWAIFHRHLEAAKQEMRKAYERSIDNGRPRPQVPDARGR